MTSPDLEIITPAALAEILHKSEATIRSDIHRAPHRLPPRVRLPNSDKLLWRKATVLEWLLKHEDQGQAT